MKKILLLLLIFIIVEINSFAQVAINKDGSQPDASSMLDVSSTEAGFLPPRMTRQQMNAIVNPANGLLIWCTDCDGSNEGLSVNYGSPSKPEWECLARLNANGPTSTACGKATTYEQISNPATDEIWLSKNLGANQVATSSTDNQSYGSLFQWGRGSDGHECIDRTTGIPFYGSSSTQSNSDIPGHNRFITVDPYSSPYDWRSPKNDNLWQGLTGINNPCPNGFRLPTESEFETERLSWTSNDITGAYTSPIKLSLNGYRNYSNGLLMAVGTNAQYWTSTISSNYAKTITISSSDATIGNSPRASAKGIRCIKDQEAKPSLLTCGYTFEYDKVKSPSGETWLNKNLGASQVATSYNDYNAYGSLYQWGRLTDGHECINYSSYNSGVPANGATSTLSNTDVPGHNRFITGSHDWRYPYNNNLWQGLTGINNPCPDGYRVPNRTELDIERQSWNANTMYGAFSSPLKLSLGGYHNGNNNYLDYISVGGFYWSSTVDTPYSSFLLRITSNNAGIYSYYKSTGCHIRCIKD